MKLAISNIAWSATEEDTVAGVMQAMKITGVEIAPTKIWPSPLAAGDAEIRDYREFWGSRGIQIVAMQALLFGRSDLTIFEQEQKRRETFAHLSGMIGLGAKLGAKVLVFGSPKNRKVGDLDQAEIERIAVPFFHGLGELALECGVTFCIEPNPTAYDADFITTSAQGLDLVRKVDSQGFGLHLDAAGMTLSQEPIESAVATSLPSLRHFHISDPYLEEIGTGGVRHDLFAKVLAAGHYKNWVSIEMKAQSSDSCLESVERVLRKALDHYGKNGS